MKKILNIYKPVGMTPLQLIQSLRKKHPEYENQKIGFAGRLDPLARGVVLLMIGNETKNREKYLSLPKEYEFEVLFGVSTDTYDSLGLITSPLSPSTSLRENMGSEYNNLGINSINLKKKINQFIESKHGKHLQAYPPFSSKEVDGKPMFQWAKENKLSEIKIPGKEIEIYNFEFLDILEIPTDDIHKRIISNIKTVDGDFRQEQIIKEWIAFFNLHKNTQFTLARFKINCSSGTYVRSLANGLGMTTGTGAIALDIFRTKVGTYRIEDSMRL